ncbi:MAG: FMN reductase [Gammaproteobacteria bacterium HGW-Gammaproteobacteria-14]|nr:MAG: FMN reductase [Gammaproteobacteria bacterium HGW-Gammaproteobacteria-14]
MSAPRVLVFAGSARRASLNKALSRVAAESARKAGLEVTWVDLRDFPIPLYDGDLEAEQGIPEHARRLRQLLDEHQGLIVVSPEYNGFITPLIKNTLDWISRPDGDIDGLASFRNKIALVMSASPGAFGGIRSLALIRQLLSQLGVTVLPEQLSVPRAHQAFNENGELQDDKLASRLDTMTQRLTQVLRHWP